MNKEQYSKPSLLIERFEFSQAIAYGCTVLNNGSIDPGSIHPREGQTGCYWEDGTSQYFSTEMGCTDTQLPGDICYHTPSGTAQMFASL